MIRKIVSFLSLVFAVVFNASAQLSPTGLDGDVKLMIGNDLGRNGYYEQKPIAALMGKLAETLGPDAFLALGDTHHYLGINSAADPLWMTNYELVYSHPELQVEWCPVLGNHEYRGNTQAVIDYSGISRRWMMPSRYYTRIFDNDGTRVKVIFIDTTPIIDKYRSNTVEYPDASRQDVDAQLRWLDNELSRDDNADWTVVAGHHPVYAQTPKQSSEREDMQRKVDPILKKHKVDMYICGHIHNFQHIRKNGIDYVVNTSGSLSRPGVTATDGTVFCSGVPGFSILTATPTVLTLSLIDNNGNIVHQVTRSK
jgi:hypothetical protein